MSVENLTNVEENLYNNMSESQTLDSLLQSTCDTPSQSESSDVIHTIESKPESVPELFRKRSHSESMNIYINTLKPKDIIIFIEDIKYFSNNTAFMNDFRISYIDPILKYLNGGEPLKNDFGRDPHTSAYSLFTFSSLNTSITETCRDTVRIIQIMEALDNFKFSERNLNKNIVSMKAILEKSRDEFLYFDNYRNNHPKRKRFLIYIFHSDICLNDIDEVVKDLNAMKVRFSTFGVFRHEACIRLSEVLNYNNKGCKDLSCFARTDRWPISISNGLYKYFESCKNNQSRNKIVKWTISREQTETNEFELINFMNSNGASLIDNTMQNIGNCVPDNQISSNISVRPMITNDTIDPNYSSSSNNLMIPNQNLIPNSNLQSKFITTSNNNYYSNASCPSEISKSSQSSYFSTNDPFYPISSSASMTQHRLTPSLLKSQSPQYHTLSSQNALPQTSLYNDQLKQNNTEIQNEMISCNSTQLNVPKGNQINQEMEMSAIQRYPHSIIPFNSNNSMNTTNFHQNRFITHQQYYPANQVRNNGTILFDGLMQYNEEWSTEFRIFIDTPIDLNLFNMNQWDKKCGLQYINYLDVYNLNIYGKNNGEIDMNHTDLPGKTFIEVQYHMNKETMEIITSTLSKQNSIIAIIIPNRIIPSELHVHCLCILLNRSTSLIKVIIPADSRSLIYEIKKRHQTNSYSVGQSNQIFNQMKRNNFVQANQQMYGISTNVGIQRSMINRYNSHSGGNMPMLSVSGNPSYRAITHPSNFTQQMSPNTGYILQQGPYSANPNQTSSGSYQIPMEMNMQSNQNIYDQNSYL